MSWDIFVQDIPVSVATAAEIPDGFEPRSLGIRSQIVSRICEVVPNADFTSPAFGHIEGPGFSIEVSLEDAEQVHSFAFHVRGGDLAATVIAEILRHLGFRAFDPSSTTGIFDLEGGSATGLRKWREYRDSIIAKSSSL